MTDSLVSPLYGTGPRHGRPVYCRCGLAFDSEYDRNEHAARPFRVGKGPRSAPAHGPPGSPGTRMERQLGAAPAVRSERIHGMTVVAPWIGPPRVSVQWRRVRPVRRRRVRIVGPPVPASTTWRARGRATAPIDRPAPVLTPAVYDRSWTRAGPPDCTAVQRTVTPTAARPALVFVSDDAPPEPTDEHLRIRRVTRVGTSAILTGRPVDRPRVQLAHLKVRTADAASVTALRRAWNRPGRWIEVRARPDPEHGTLYFVLAGRLHTGPRRPSGNVVGTPDPIEMLVNYGRSESR